jgi:GT2 family glycosyltransferase
LLIARRRTIFPKSTPTDLEPTGLEPTGLEPTGLTPADREPAEVTPTDLAPTTTVVICAFADDRWGLLQEAVSSVEDQAHPADQLVVVIDHNGGLLGRARERWPHHTVVANAARRGLSGARNTGVAAATGAVVAFLDDDAAAEPGWLAALVPHFADEAVGGVGGSVVPRWLSDPPEWFPDEFLWVVGCSYEGLPASLAPVRNPIGANMAFRKSVLDAAGGFSEEVGRVGSLPVGCEETELSLRAGALGFTVLYDPRAVVHHAVPAVRGRLRYFVQRCQSEGRSKAVVSKMAAAQSGALATEQRYVTRVLPRGVVRSLRRARTAEQRRAGFGAAGAIVLGFAVTSGGYAEGRFRNRASVHPLAQADPVPTAETAQEAAA